MLHQQPTAADPVEAVEERSSEHRAGGHSLKTTAALLLACGAEAAATESGSFELAAVKAKIPPVVDGVIGRDEWEEAARAADFIQYEPQRGERSPYLTEAFVAYDGGHLYVAFHARDPEPLTAGLTQRDADLFGDDSVIVLLDSNRDRQTAFYFMTNPLGTQADGRVAEDGRVRDTSWDAAWESAARRTGDGWAAEIRIPFKSIKFAAGEDVTWGLNLGRSRRRSLEISFWAGPLENRDRVSQAGRLVGLNVEPPLDRIQIVPFALSQFQEGTRRSGQAGVDVRYALTSQLAAYATLNPDFATIEGDQETVNLTRFEISLAEKRQFFLEGQELFRQGIRFQIFYSRRIADITAGGKLLGRAGPWTVNLMAVDAEPSSGGGRARFTVARAQRDLGRSYVAATVADRRRNQSSQGSAGVDVNLFVTKRFGFMGQLAESYGRHGSGSLAFFLRPSYDSPTGHLHLRYSHIGDRFADNAEAVGLIRDDDRREADAAAHKTLWFKKGAAERLEYNSNYKIYWSQRGRLRGWEIRQSVEADLRNRWSGRISYIEDLQRFEKGFRNRQTGVEVGYNTREYQSVKAGVTFGRNFDSNFALWTGTARRKVKSQLSIEYELQRLTLNPDADMRSTWIHVLRANQFFTKDLFMRVFFQTNSAIDRRNLQAIFFYRYRPPFGTVQVAFQRGSAAFGRRSEQGNTLFLKITTVF